MPAAKGLPVRKPKAIKVPRVCGRCRRRLSNHAVREGWVVLRDGFIESTVCLPCTTPSELADLLLLEVGSECGLNTDGRILTRRKRFPTPAE